MYTHTLKKLPKNTSEILVNVDKDTIQKEYKISFAKLLQNFEMQGFRKGKVPASIAEKHLKKETVYEELIRRIIPKIYDEISKKEDIKPVIQPKIELEKANESEDWQIKITVASKPTITLGDYKESIKKIKSDQKKDQIWTPGKDTTKSEESEKDKSKKQQELMNQVLSAVLKETTIEISDLIIEEELNQRLANLLTEIQKIGLTVDSYLKSKNMTKDDLNKRYKDEIEQTYKLEFVLADIADKENIKVENSDLEKLFAGISDPKEREAARTNSYFYASVLRKQKTLDYLLAL
ncbi:hypothetical protein A2767_04890 [Candidatus Roizmanbacteria bacterium RIFCSPHIGHO2_01_FULL_35_10]|uniref:Uncharacterized protein n=1 Tax=Candidatus Roizmanbacteria bacterium RIFCSPLOWO2_01_FULL_35_13 TaxID=1802055 RepID=A0A1F7I760_9BACT|nr:MAG: hypothetical protein A2767_04890 [Candidatus Roizmanbacteria bacterium RIFCSPHIGHO2_01_FULL_35_10]OGK39206.1 MAG: hypothetical protein A3A74_07635 [Candidatus Roizmanbacteria bacterium RIFCSPLOWO2_01_FULL_35_13]